jgi:hypothetical protein
MKTIKKKNNVNEMTEEYDFSSEFRGKHSEAYRKGNTIKIDKREGSVEVHSFTKFDNLYYGIYQLTLMISVVSNY